MTMKEKLHDVGHKVSNVVHKITHPLDFDFDHSAGKIFITGGCGVVGYRVASRLLKAGYPTIRLGVRNPDKVADLNEEGAEVADFSWEREDTYEKALEGVKTVFCTIPHHKGWDERFPSFLKACEKAGVKNFVKLSFYHAGHAREPFVDVPLVRQHGECDKLLAKSRLSHTILAASHFMSNPLIYQEKNLRVDRKPATFYGSSGGKKVNYVSPNDIAEFAVRALLAPKEHARKVYTLTGPTPITDQEVASLLGKHLDKPVMFVDQPLHTFEEGEKFGGDPSWLVADLVALEKVKASGKEEDLSFLSTDFERVCGHPAETFEEYLGHRDFMTRPELLA